MRTNIKVLGGGAALAGVIAAGTLLQQSNTRRISAQDRLDSKPCVTKDKPVVPVPTIGPGSTTATLTMQDKPVIDHSRSEKPCYIDYTAVVTGASGKQSVNNVRTYWTW